MNDLEQFNISDVNNTAENNYGKAIGISNTTIGALKKQPFISFNVATEPAKKEEDTMKTEEPLNPIIPTAPVMNASPVNTDIKLTGPAQTPVVPKFIEPAPLLEKVPVATEEINPLNLNSEQTENKDKISNSAVPNLLDTPFNPQPVEDPTLKTESKFNVDIPLISSNDKDNQEPLEPVPLVTPQTNQSQLDIPFKDDQEPLEPVPLVTPQFKTNEKIDTMEGGVVSENKFVINSPELPKETSITNMVSPEPIKPKMIEMELEDKTNLTSKSDIVEAGDVALEEALENIKKIAHDSIDQIFAELSKAISKSTNRTQNMDLVNQSIDDGMKKLNEVINVPSQPIDNNSFKL